MVAARCPKKAKHHFRIRMFCPVRENEFAYLLGKRRSSRFARPKHPRSLCRVFRHGGCPRTLPAINHNKFAAHMAPMIQRCEKQHPEGLHGLLEERSRPK